MLNFQKFLVPVDGSPASERAAAKAVDLATLTGAHIDLIYISELRSGPMSQHVIPRKSLPDDVVASLKKTGQDIVERIYNSFPEDIQKRTSCHSEVGDPKEIIVNAIAELSSDLIIMGTRGLNPTQAFMLGSVSNHMIECASCPIMVVH